MLHFNSQVHFYVFDDNHVIFAWQACYHSGWSCEQIFNVNMTYARKYRMNTNINIYDMIEINE